MEFIFRRIFIYGNELTFFFIGGIIISIIIACFVLGYLEVKK